MKEKLKEQKGITLIALIITIIVMLILAGVSINIIQNQGIITKSKTAVDKYQEEEIKEQIDNLNKEINPLRKEVVLCKDIIERSKKMEQNLQELSDEKNQEKEVEKNEHIR